MSAAKASRVRVRLAPKMNKDGIIKASKGMGLDGTRNALTTIQEAQRWLEAYKTGIPLPAYNKNRIDGIVKGLEPIRELFRAAWWVRKGAVQGDDDDN